MLIGENGERKGKKHQNPIIHLSGCSSRLSVYTHAFLNLVVIVIMHYNCAHCPFPTYPRKHGLHGLLISFKFLIRKENKIEV